MHFEDLSPYTYLRSAVRGGMLNVGWLDANHSYPTADPDPTFVTALWGFCQLRVAPTRGYHTCELCPDSPIGPLSVSHGQEILRLGTAEIRVFGPDGVVFAAPDMIFHYVRVHRYAPPELFVSAVLSGPQPGTEEFQTLLEDLLSSGS